MSFNRIAFQRDADTPVGNYGYVDSVVDYEEEVDPGAEAEVTPEQAPEVKVETTETPVAEVTPVVEAAPAVEPVEADWREVIKKADKYEAMKELGLGDFEIELLKYKEQTGDLTPYLEAKTVDYKSMTPEQILRIDLKRANPGLSDKAIDFKLRERTSKYFLDRDEYPEESDEAQIGKELLQADSEAIRQKLIEEQAKFKAPEPKPDTTKIELEKQQAELQTKQRDFVINNPVTKALQAAKSITIGEGEGSFNYLVGNVDALVSNAVTTILNSNTADVPEAELKKFYQALAIGADLPRFLKEYGDHHQALAKKSIQSGLQNVTGINEGIIAPPKPNKNYGYKP